MKQKLLRRLNLTTKLSLLSTLFVATASATQPTTQAEKGSNNQSITTDNKNETHAAIQKAIQAATDRHEVAGVVGLVVTSEGPVYLGASGSSDIESKRAMRTDDIFWIASMSKPVTGVAVMILVDQGKLSLDEPIGTYLPELKNPKLEDGTPVTITLRHLMTHTSGMKELPGGEAYAPKTLAEATTKYAPLPISFQPGTKWQYSQTSINTAARIVEVASGQTFDRFIEEHIFAPLGMKDTTFYLNESQAQRLVSSYEVGADQSFKKTKIWLLGSKAPTDRDRLPAANGGLFSTAEDYGRFCSMLLGKGKLGDKRILSEEAVKVFSSQAIDDLATGFTPGNTWGIGCCIVKEPQGVSKDLSPGSFGHGGAFGTQAWIDPTKNRAYILMVQRSNFPNADNSDARKEFQEAASKAPQ